MFFIIILFSFEHRAAAIKDTDTGAKTPEESAGEHAEADTSAGEGAGVEKPPAGGPATPPEGSTEAKTGATMTPAQMEAKAKIKELFGKYTDQGMKPNEAAAAALKEASGGGGTPQPPAATTQPPPTPAQTPPAKTPEQIAAEKNAAMGIPTMKSGGAPISNNAGASRAVGMVNSAVLPLEESAEVRELVIALYAMIQKSSECRKKASSNFI